MFVIHFEAAQGNWVLWIYDGMSLGAETGQIFHIVSVTFNMILMLNLVIAILMETYARLAPQRLGLYYDGLIASLPIRCVGSFLAHGQLQSLSRKISEL